MIEYNRDKQASLADKAALRICVAGIGGAGSNVLDRITLDRTVEADLVSFHTDVRVLNHGMATNKVQLGGDLMKGVGAGGDPDLGREAALYSKEQIRQALDGHEIIFLCTGLGGGTGSGASPVIAEIAKSTGALVVVLATMPFSFEGRRRLAQAEEALELLQKRTDALVLFENNRMGELVLPKEGIQKAFSLADQTIAQCARAVASMVSTQGLIKLGLDDLMSALNASNGRCLFGFGEGKGANRGADALKKALKSPLIDQGRLLQQTKNLLVHIVGGESLTLMEVDAIMKQLGRSVPEQTQILFGLAVDPKLTDALSVTLISSLGLEHLNVKHVMREEVADAPPPVLRAPAPKLTPPKMQAPPPAPAPAPVVARAPEPPAPPVLQLQEEEPLELFGSVEETQDAEPENEAPEPAVAEVESEIEEEIEIEDEAPAVVEAAAEPPVVDEFIAEEEIAVAVNEVAQFKDEPVDEEEFSAQFAPPPPPVEEPPPPPQVQVRPTRNEPRTSPRPSTLAAVLSAPSIVSRKPQPALAVAGGQQTFSLGEEDRGRFKDTEPSLADGEDLDVPTWMRMRKKLRR